MSTLAQWSGNTAGPSGETLYFAVAVAVAVALAFAVAFAFAFAKS